MGDEVSRIRHDYKAVHESGPRPADAIRLLVIHSGETSNPDTAAEGMGAWFENRASGGSAHYGCDNNSTQQYLGDLRIAWGAPGVNRIALHIEIAGRAVWTRREWLRTVGPALHRAGWLLGDRAREYGIPLRRMAPAGVAQLVEHPGGRGGFCGHATVTAGVPGGSHTDPGAGFPWDVLLLWAHHRPGDRPILHEGSSGPMVARVQRAVGAREDSHFGAATRQAVQRWQARHGLSPDGVVGPATWRVLDR